MKTKKVLLIDNYDSFTYNLYDYFLQLEADCTVVRNDEWSKDELASFEMDGLVLSPGPKKPSDAGLLQWMIEYFHNKKPILGICLGHQGIGEFFGAKLIKAKLPIHGKTSIIEHDGSSFYKDIPNSLEVMRYHSLILESLEGTPLQTTAATSSREIMSFQHETLPIYGVQFHPESILTQYGLKMLNNWLDSL